MFTINEISHAQKRDFLPLLLLGDEQLDMVERYLDRGRLFALCDPELKTVCVVTQEAEKTFEIKNLATDPRYQRQGYGRAMVQFVLSRFLAPGVTVRVGTGENPATLRFYEHCGFARSHVIKNFFLEHYDHAIIENGVQLKDMIYLSVSA